MGKSLEVKLNYAGVGQLLKSAEMRSLLNETARRVAGPQGETDVFVAGTRAVAEARQRGLNNDMLKRLK